MAEQKTGNKQAQKREWKPSVYVVAVPPACPNCGSIRRGEKYHGVVENEVSGEINGHKYTHVISRRTSCPEPDCLQTRTELWYEDRSEK